MDAPEFDRPLRVVYVGHVARLSGGELALSRLLTALGDRVDATVILAEDGPLIPVLKERGVDVRILPLDPTVRDVRRDQVGRALLHPRQLVAGVRYLRRLTLLIRSLQADIVHTNTLKAGVYGSLAARLARVPSLWHVRDRLASDYLPFGTAVIVRELVRWLPDAVVANSQVTLSTLRTPRQGALVLYNVIPEIAENPLRNAPRDYDMFRVGIVGRLADWKGQDVFLKAVKVAFADDPSVHAVLVGSALFDGEGHFEQDLRDLAVTLDLTDRVEFRGFREDVRAELDRLDVLVHASILPEPFGQVVLEGLAAGLPVVATEEGGPSEIITHQRSGLLYPAGDVGALAVQLRLLFEHPELRRSLGEAGLRRAAHFSPAAVSGQMMTVYARLLGKRLIGGGALPASGARLSRQRT